MMYRACECIEVQICESVGNQRGSMLILESAATYESRAESGRFQVERGIASINLCHL
jgi:hypothetical protein